MGVSLRSSPGLPELPPSILATQPRAAGVGNCTTILVGVSPSTQRTMQVTVGSEATYSSYVCTMTDSVVAVDFARTFAVSWVPH